MKSFLQRSLRLRRVVHWSVRLESFGETRGMNPSYLPQERRVVLRRVLILVFYVYVYFVKAPYVLVCMLQVIRRGHRECERGVKVKCKGQGPGVSSCLLALCGNSYLHCHWILMAGV